MSKILTFRATTTRRRFDEKSKLFGIESRKTASWVQIETRRNAKKLKRNRGSKSWLHKENEGGSQWSNFKSTIES